MGVKRKRQFWILYLTAFALGMVTGVVLERTFGLEWQTRMSIAGAFIVLIAGLAAWGDR